MQLVKITKIQDLRPLSLEDFFPTYFGFYQTSPIVGNRFNIGLYNQEYYNRGLSTSPVKEILSETTFKTLNSIYEWELIK